MTTPIFPEYPVPSWQFQPEPLPTEVPGQLQTASGNQPSGGLTEAARSAVETLLTAKTSYFERSGWLTDVPTHGTELWVALRRRATGPSATETNWLWVQLPMIEELIGPDMSSEPTKAQSQQFFNPDMDAYQNTVINPGTVDWGTVTGSVLWNTDIASHTSGRGLLGYMMTQRVATFAKFYRPPSQTLGMATVHYPEYAPENRLEVLFNAYVTRFRPIDRVRQPKRVDFQLTLTDRPVWYQNALY